MNSRLIFISSLMLCFIACKTNKESAAKENLNTIHISNCPEEGTCTFEIFNNSSLEIKKDGIGAQYPQVSDGKKTVIKFEYKKNEDPMIVDDGYTEVIFAEIDPATKTLNLEDVELRQAKALFGRLCFCRGQTGYYPVDKGELDIKTNKDKSTTYTFNLEIIEVPQVLRKISVTLE